MTANVSEITYENEELHLSWTAKNATRVVHCNFDATEVNGAVTFKPLATKTYTITVEGPDGSATDSVTVPVTYETNVRLTADKTIIAPGETTKLRWASTASSTVFASSFGATGATGVTDISPNATTTYSITMHGDYGTATAYCEVQVIAPPTITITASPNPSRYGTPVKLQWESANATKVVTTNLGTSALDGTRTVTPPVGTTRYYMTVMGPTGTATGEVLVTVYDKPYVLITAEPDTIVYGATTKLHWQVLFADSVTSNFGVGAGEMTGEIEVQPKQTTTYSITGVSAGGNTTATVQVRVRPIIKLTALPALIDPGENTILTWTTSPNATHVVSSNFAAPGLNGSKTVAPPETMVYTITVSDGEFNETATATVEVTGNIDVIIK